MTYSTPFYIFDLDGTLTDPTHRRHLVRDGRRDWPAFYEASSQDPVNEPVARTFRLLRPTAVIWIWSARSDEVQQSTEEYLQRHQIVPDQLRMRPKGDWRPDEVLKESWLHEMSLMMRSKLIAVFDDRRKVVDMWRKNHVHCFQVAPGLF